jgi:hypothetical protein
VRSRRVRTQPYPRLIAIVGPGLDGELPAADVQASLTAAGAAPAQLKANHVEPYLSALEYHPSEATTLLAGAALGLIGKVEIRDKAALVPLTEDDWNAELVRGDLGNSPLPDSRLTC